MGRRTTETVVVSGSGSDPDPTEDTFSNPYNALAESELHLLTKITSIFSQRRIYKLLSVELSKQCGTFQKYKKEWKKVFIAGFR